MNAPADFNSLIRDFAALREDISFVRALRNLTVATANGDLPIRSSPGARNTLLDLRGLTATGAPPAGAAPTPQGYFTAMSRMFVQSIGNNATVPIVFDRQLFNANALWQSANATRFTLPVAGVWLFSAWVDFAKNGTGTRQIKLLKNGSSNFGQYAGPAAQVVDFSSATVAAIENFAAGDYVEMLVLQNSGAALNATGRMSVVRLSDAANASSTGYRSETEAWMNLVSVNEGVMAGDSISIADALVVALRKGSYFSKIVYLLPLLGGNLAAARCPLIDPLGFGIASNTNFVDADFTQAAGLQGNGTSKILTLPLNPSQLGTNGNGGLGYIENNIDLAGSSEAPIGCYNTGQTTRFLLDLRANVRNCRWGAPGNGAGDTTAAANGRYYGQRAGATSRELFVDEASVGTNATNDAAAGASDNLIRLMGSNGGGGGANVFWKGRCACAYLTNGTLTATEIAELGAALRAYLIVPTGR